ncbi:Polyadenylate-binding protein 2 [Labeo rohita]|uniref:Polyadenylate-binding protein 2 n=1 Tax=Labeo rohita TaxID=84645 RepID=A0ABQ8LEC8_LABRO|nr:Polyadenylate-binding protein 2 [Labeo rohita]
MAEFGNGLAEESLLDSDPGHSELEDPGVGDEEPGLDEGEAAIEDPELEAIKARVREMEEEAEKLKELQNEVEKQMNLSPPPAGPVIMSIEEKMEADGRSIYVGNVDYGATAEELEAHFHGCGSVNRVTILCDKFTGHPKGLGPREQIALALAPQTAVSLGPASAHGEETSRPGRATTVATHPPEAEDGPSGELSANLARLIVTHTGSILTESAAVKVCARTGVGGQGTVQNKWAEGEQHRGTPLTNTSPPPYEIPPYYHPTTSCRFRFQDQWRLTTPPPVAAAPPTVSAASLSLSAPAMHTHPILSVWGGGGGGQGEHRPTAGGIYYNNKR